MRVRADELPPATQDDVVAIRAVFRGTAHPGQQQRAMRYLLRLCGLNALEGASLSDGERHFIAGKRWVAQALLQAGQISFVPDLMRDMDERDTSSDA